MPPRGKDFRSRLGAERRTAQTEAVEDLVSSRLAPRAISSQDLPIDRIRPNPYQSRREFPDLDDLAEAIRQQGFISRLRVRPDPAEDGYYQLVYGERRLRAAAMAGLTMLPCDVAPHSDTELIEIGLVENIQRQDLNPLEEARAFQTFINELNYSVRRLAERLGKHRSYVDGRLAILRAPEDVQDLVTRRPDTLDAARQIASVDDPTARQPLIEGVANGTLSSQDVREHVSRRRAMTAEDQQIPDAPEPPAPVPPVEGDAPVPTITVRQHPRPDPGEQRIQREMARITAVLDSWERLLIEQPEQAEAVQDGLNAILLRAQILLERLEKHVK
jgi:ParB family chromosome partitioning protein